MTLMPMPTKASVAPLTMDQARTIVRTNVGATAMPEQLTRVTSLPFLFGVPTDQVRLLIDVAWDMVHPPKDRPRKRDPGKRPPSQRARC